MVTSTTRRRAGARRRFLAFYPGGFGDDDYVALERHNKLRAHERFRAELSRGAFEAALRANRFEAVADAALRAESTAKLLFSFEKMAIRDATRGRDGARIFAEGLHELLHGGGRLSSRFARWVDAVAHLPHERSRVLTWPVLTVFPFLADPARHLYLKPLVTLRAAERWGFDFRYAKKPAFETYQSLLDFAQDIASDLERSRFPGGRGRDQIDLQSFIWVLGSDEYD